MVHRLESLYPEFRSMVDRFREGSDRPDPQLREVYEQWMRGMEWQDARAVFSLYCRLNRLLHSPFVEALLREVTDKSVTISGPVVEFRGSDAVSTIGGWMLGAPVPGRYHLTAAGPDGSVEVELVTVRRDGTRYLLQNPPGEDAITSLRNLVSMMEA